VQVALEQAVRVTLAVQVLSQAIFPKVAVAVALVPLEAMEMQLGVVEVMGALELLHPYQAQALHTLAVVAAVHTSLRLLLAMVVLEVAVRVVLTLAQQVAQAQVLQRLERQTQAEAVAETE
jgi:hypothetical protein